MSMLTISGRPPDDLRRSPTPRPCCLMSGKGRTGAGGRGRGRGDGMASYMGLGRRAPGMTPADADAEAATFAPRHAANLLATTDDDDDPEALGEAEESSPRPAAGAEAAKPAAAPKERFRFSKRLGGELDMHLLQQARAWAARGHPLVLTPLACGLVAGRRGRLPRRLRRPAHLGKGHHDYSVDGVSPEGRRERELGRQATAWPPAAEGTHSDPAEGGARRVRPARWPRHVGRR